MNKKFTKKKLTTLIVKLTKIILIKLFKSNLNYNSIRINATLSRIV